MDLDIYYDFVEDCLKGSKYYKKYKYKDKKNKEKLEENSVIEKLIFYKNAKGKYDPDSASEKLQNVYKEKWNSVKSQWFMNEKMKENSNEKICSDTMTSVQVIINRAMKLYDEKTEEKKIKELYGKWGKNQEYSYKVFNVVYNEKEGGKDIIEKLFKDTDITRLLEMYHTIGNYCPVPCYFNAARSGTSAMHDFWDLTLMKIREYYTECDGSEISIAKILGGLLHNSGNIITCKAWLDYFGKGEYGWENFIKENYLEDYIDGDREVKPFWEGHSWKDSLPNDLDTLKDGVNEIVDRIEKRGNRILGKTEEEDKPSDTNVSKD